MRLPVGKPCQRLDAGYCSILLKMCVGRTDSRSPRDDERRSVGAELEHRQMRLPVESRFTLLAQDTVQMVEASEVSVPIRVS